VNSFSTPISALYSFWAPGFVTISPVGFSPVKRSALMEKTDKDLESGGTHPQNISYWKLLSDQGVLTQDVVD